MTTTTTELSFRNECLAAGLLPDDAIFPEEANQYAETCGIILDEDLSELSL